MFWSFTVLVIQRLGCLTFLAFSKFGYFKDKQTCATLKENQDLKKRGWFAGPFIVNL
jgi:hypothetical protein